MGPTKPSLAQELAPGSIRALHGLTDTRNSVHGSGELLTLSEYVYMCCSHNDVISGVFTVNRVYSFLVFIDCNTSV